MGSTGHGLWSSCDWWILICFACFCVSRFVSCDHNYDWWQWKPLSTLEFACLWKAQQSGMVMKPAIPLCDMFCIFFTYIFVFGAQRLIIAFLSFSSCKQIKTSQQFFQSQLFCKQKNNIHVTCCGHCRFLAFHNRSHQTGLVISPGRAHIELSHDLKHKL